jgi:hypothetical protein
MGQGHIAELKPDKSHDKGCVTKHQDKYKDGDRCSYRGNGYSEMKSAHKDLYEIDFTQPSHAARLPRVYAEYKIGGKKIDSNLRTAVNPRETKDAWWFSTMSNYKVAYLPFNHNYHHILPFVALSQLSYDELKLVQLSGYNLNGPKNMIILPCLDNYGVAMMLPSHPFGHTDYNDATEQIVEELKNDVARNSEGHELDDKNVGDLKTKLESWQGRQFQSLVDYGRNDIAKASPFDPPPNQVNKAPIAGALG